jgi:hypothetical protein
LKNHENEWDCILIDPRDYDLYNNDELKAKIFSRIDIEERDKETEFQIDEIITNLLEENVNAITITQGSVDWKYGRRFSFTFATSYDIIKVCVRKCWHLYENKPHFQAVKTYLDGSFPREQEVEDGAQQQQEDAARQNEDLDSQYDSDFVPETMQQQMKGDICKLNNDLISANEFCTSPFYAQRDYLEAFIQHVTHKSDVSYRKAILKTQAALKKLVDLWLDELNKERRKYFFESGRSP